LDDREGRAVVEVSDDDLATHAAAAVAVIKAAWAWDESEHFDITVNGTGYSVVAAYDGGTWCAHATLAHIDSNR
jgi:hypothetical protein